jgi:hypothetical protein
VLTATNYVTQSNDQGEAVTQQQVGTVVVTATGEGEGEQSELFHVQAPFVADNTVTATDPDATATTNSVVIVTQTLSDTTTGANGEQSVVIAVCPIAIIALR